LNHHPDLSDPKRPFSRINTFCFAAHARPLPLACQKNVKKTLEFRTFIAGRARSPLSENKNC